MAIRPIVLSLVLYSFATIGNAANEAGWIEYFSGPSTHYSIERQGQLIPAQILSPLYVNDRLLIHSDNDEVHLRLFGLGLQVLTKSDSPFTVEAVKEAPGVLGNLMEWVGSWVTQQHDEQQQRLASMVVRNDRSTPSLQFELPREPLDLPMLVRGKRSLLFSIKNGQPPYHLSLRTQAGGEVVFDLPGLDRQEVRTPSAYLAEGVYQVTISDARGGMYSAYFRAVSERLLPKPPPGATEPSNDNSLNVLIMASWLAAYGEGEWGYEGYQMAGQISANSYPARVVLRSITEGSIPAAIRQ